MEQILTSIIHQTGFHPVWYRMLGKNCFPVQILRFCRFCINSYILNESCRRDIWPTARRQQKVPYYLRYNILLTNPQPTTNNTQNQNGPPPVIFRKEGGVKYYPRQYIPVLNYLHQRCSIIRGNIFQFWIICANGYVDDTDDRQTLSAVKRREVN